MAITKQAILIGIGTATVAGGGAGAFLLLQDKTIKDRLVSQGHVLIETDDEYEVSFKEFKSTSGYIDLIKGSNSGLNSGSELSVGRKALKKWCDDNLKLGLTEDNIRKSFENTKKYCTKPPLTIADKLSNSKRALINNWSDKLNSLKTPSDTGDLLSDLQKINDQIKSLNDTGNIVHVALKDWCKLKIKTKLTEDKTDAIWNKIESRCLEPIQPL